MKRNHFSSLLALTILAGFLTLSAAPAQALSGAIFTTDKNNSVVNENLYSNMEAVYISGGPKKIGPAGLPEGYYYFQVTDPSGKVLLSTDGIGARWFWVNGDGVMWYPPPKGKYAHKIWPNYNNSQEGLIVMQLSPYLPTPNKGGVYKVWVTRTEDYDESSGRFGFVPAYSKTDNFKVGKGPPDQKIYIRKFLDADADGLWDQEEKELEGWYLTITPPADGSPSPWTGDEFTTPCAITAWPGLWKIEETLKSGWKQTVVRVDEERQDPPESAPHDPPYPASMTFGTSDKTCTVVFGNIPTGSITVGKFYDRDKDGDWDADEPGIQGVKVTLNGTDIRGVPIDEQTAYTGEGGKVSSSGLLPGTYTVTEVVPTNCAWQPTTETSATVTLTCEQCENNQDQTATVGFGNIITGSADFDTKGYWHNKNGLGEITEEDIEYVNELDPYDDSTSYFDACDEPFEGHYADGRPVPAALNGATEIAPEGSSRAEISHFLVDRNATGDPCEQLAQQLLAFIFNVQRRLGGDAMIKVGEGEDDWMSTGAIVDDAIAAWKNGTPDRVAMGQLLDKLNNGDAVMYVLNAPPDTCVPIPEY